MNNNIAKLAQILGVKINNEQFYFEALTHSSYANENNVKCNERLEFLGDAVLELLMSDYLTKNEDLSEGEMTKKRARCVCEMALVSYAHKINLNELILLGKGEEQSGGRERDAIIADCFEAVLGAVYLDLGFDACLKVFKRIIQPYLSESEDIIDFKSTLQELVQADKRSLTYEIVSEKGPSHNKVFEAIVKMDDIIMGYGTGKTKKDAEQNAAREALKKMSK